MGYYWYDSRNFMDKEVFLESKFSGIFGVSLIGRIGLVNRFGKENSQLGLDYYRRLGRGFWGYLSGDLSPEADFLPRYSLGGGVFRSYRRLEPGVNLRYMRFRDSEVFLLAPSITLYLPKGAYHTATLYLNVKRSTFSLLNRFGYKDRQKELFLSISFGTSSERLQAGEDFVRYSTFSAGAGGELRLTDRISLGASLKFEDRRGLYRRYGVSAYGRLWW